MYYKVKKGDMLGKISKKYKIPVQFILAHNSIITNADMIFEGQLIYIPNLEDIPVNKFKFSEKLTADDIIKKAKSVIGKKIIYKLGAGGMDEKYHLPTKDGKCDCSGFVCWVLGLSRKTKIPFYQPGGWIYTDSMVDDINRNTGIFDRLTVPEVGCIVVYGAGKEIGHVGLVSEVENGRMKKVIHCSSGNYSSFNDAIQETSPKVFERADALWGRFVG
ncbi:LysM peptidoglycan-binding domain-containing protein [Chryseobacterium sp. Mn2064]|uniref:C40 family peptidase n=1 Tax=Chryseobacterium sp. Mn2064 TaxID=3395263 RepID=UPI003BBB9C09